jgi:nucleoside diphosphate kinase
MTPDKIVEKTHGAIEASNRVLIKELISDLEEKGIKPVVAIDGEVKKLRLINESELEDFYYEIDHKSISREDFAVLEVDDTKYHNDGLYFIEGQVIVVYKKSGKSKEYKAGNASHWVADFALDLKNNFFTN